MLHSMARLPLQTLPAFRAVARSENLREAAEQLHLTPSAISQPPRSVAVKSARVHEKGRAART